MSVVPTQKTIGILGGGISGLSAAYYLRKTFGNSVKAVIFEKSPRCGGWIRTLSRTDGNDSFHYELGPRTMRPGAGESGMNTLDLVEELGLSGQVLYVKGDHPAAKTRFIFHKERLVKFPTDMSVLFKKTEPLEKALIFAGLRDLIKWRKKLEDDSIHNFVQRRFGLDIANYIIDPAIRGICAGDSRQISVKFLMKNLFQYEQKYGSALLGLLLSRFGKKEETKLDVGYSNIALTSLGEKWSVWTLESGLQLLPWAIEDNLSKEENVIIKKNCHVKSIRIGDRTKNEVIEVEYNPESETKSSEILACDHLISTIPCIELGKLIRRSKPSHPSLWRLFETMDCADVQVTNLMYKNKGVLKQEAFGFLVPSSEKSVPGLLGVVFDTCSFPQGDRQILTAMSRPTPEAGHDIDTICSYLKTTLSINEKPDDFNIEILRKCIPQYTVGHYEKVEAIRRYIKAGKFRLSLAGASFDGVSVNDSIYSAKKAAESIDLDE